MKYQVCRPLTPIEYAALKADIAASGVLVPVEQDEAGEILDGHHRMQAWRELCAEGFNLPDVPVIVRSGMAEEEKRNHARRLNALRRQLSDEERRQIMRDMRADGAPYQDIARSAGVSYGTAYNATRDIPIIKIDNRYGVTRPAQYESKSTGHVLDMPTLGYEVQAESVASEEGGYDWTEPEEATGPAPATGAMAVHYSSDRHDWATPPDLFALIDAEFHFTLDVCATAVSAKCHLYFTPEIDGLEQNWAGHVCWMNPPYGDEIAQWMDKARREGEATTVVCLVPARVDTGWWWDNAIYGEIRFLKGRVRFLQPDAEPTGAPFPSALVVFGPGVKAKTVWWDWKNNVRL